MRKYIHQVTNEIKKKSVSLVEEENANKNPDENEDKITQKNIQKSIFSTFSGKDNKEVSVNQVKFMFSNNNSLENETAEKNSAKFKGPFVSNKRNFPSIFKEEKHLIESKTLEKKIAKPTLCIPQRPFHEVTIEYNAENENIPVRELSEDKYFAHYNLKENLNYSIKPSKNYQKDNFNEESHNKKDFVLNLQKEKIEIYNFFDYVGFALANVRSIQTEDYEFQQQFEIKKGDPVVLRKYTQNENLIECKYFDKIGLFRKNDFYFWENNIPNVKNEEDIESPGLNEGPSKPNIFTKSKR